MNAQQKVPWHGILKSIQSRIRLTRSYDERSHTYLGYMLTVDGQLGSNEREFLIAIGKAAQAKHDFQVGDEVSGESVPVANPRMEASEFYKTSKLKRINAINSYNPKSPPFLGIPPTLEVYRERGHRRLAAATYKKKCLTCIWGCRMPVEMIVDQWNPSNKRYRFETFCYGPKSCKLYKAGPTRKVPGRKKWMVYEEEDWVDEDSTSHRGLDD